MSDFEGLRRVSLDKLTDMVSHGDKELLRRTREEVDAARKAGCGEGIGKMLLLAREEFEDMVGGQHRVALKELYRVVDRLGFFNGRMADIDTPSIAQLFYDLHQANLDHTERSSLPAPTPPETVEKALKIIERYNVDDKEKLRTCMLAGSFTAPFVVAEPNASTIAGSFPVAGSLPAPFVGKIDELTASALKFRDAAELATFCKDIEIREAELSDLVFVITKFRQTPDTVRKVLEDGVSLQEFARQLRVSEEFEIQIIESYPEKDLSEDQLATLHSDPWSVESYVLNRFVEYFSDLSADGLEDDTSDLMIALGKVRYLFPGSLNDCVKECINIAEVLETNHFEEFLHRINHHGSLVSPHGERLEFDKRHQTNPSSVQDTDLEDDEFGDFDIPKV